MRYDIKSEDFDLYIYDEEDSRMNYVDFIDNFITDFKQKCKSFSECDIWVSEYGFPTNKYAILENSLFNIALEDNEWSIAVILIQKSEYDVDYSIKNLQKNFIQYI